MITQTVTVTERNTQNIIIGRRGTYNTEEIVFDLAPLISQFGDGTAVLLVKRSADASAYPAVTERSGSNLVWTISDTDTYYKGHGKCELYWYVDGGLAKTAIWSLTVLRDLGETTEAPPDPYETWVDTLVDLGAETLANAQAAEQSASDAASSAGTAYGYARGAAESQYQAQQARDKAVEARQGAERARDEAWEISSHYPTIIDGYWAVWHDGQYWKTDYKAEGVDGRGITSVTGVKSSTSGLVDTYTLTVTYTDGNPDTITFTVTNGRDGTDGTDGVSPGVTITDITGGHRVTITDKDHPTGQSFDVMDGEVSAADLKAVADSKAPVIIDTASGAIASFSDGADGMPIKALTVSIEPLQSGTGDPSPTNVRPISGWTGLNLTKAGKNILSWFGYTKVGWYCKLPNIFAKLPLGTNLTFSIDKLDSDSHGFAMQLVDANESTIGTLSGYNFGNTEFTRTWAIDNIFKTAKYFRLAGNWSGLTKELCDAAHFQVEIGSTRTSYEAPASEIPITWQDSAGTVYGGTDEIVSGGLVSNMDIVDLGSLPWVYNGSGYMFSSGIASDVKKPSSNTQTANILSSSFATKSAYAVGSGTNGIGIEAGGNIRVRTDGMGTDPTAFKTAVTGVQLCYELATPLTYQLDPITLSTLYGTNNIFADCGDVSVDYPCDTRKYIEKLTAPTEDDMIANANIAANKFFMVGNVLYFSTAAIAQGATIVPGNNCNKVSLADALNTLNA